MTTYDRIIIAIDTNRLTWEQVAEAALTYLTDAELAHMAIGEEWFINESDEDEDKWYKTN
jgi:hypothetical protein